MHYVQALDLTSYPEVVEITKEEHDRMRLEWKVLREQEAFMYEQRFID